MRNGSFRITGRFLQFGSLQSKKWRSDKEGDLARVGAIKKVAITMGLLTGVACGEMKVEVNGVRVVGKGYSSKKDAMNGELRAFNWSAGTSVALLVKSDGAKIVSLNEKKSKITVFSDDQGTDFMKVKSRFSNNPYKFEWSKVSEDGVALGTTIASDGLPAKGAKSLIIKGELVVATGSKFEEKKSEKVKPEDGGVVEVGGFSFKISNAGDPEWGEMKFQVTLSTSTDLDAIQGFVFYDQDGKKLESEDSGSGTSSFGSKTTYSKTFQFKDKPAHLVMGLNLWTDLEVVTVPIDLNVGAGL